MKRQLPLIAVILALFASVVFAEKFPGACRDCHEETVKLYEKSIHGKARIGSGLIVAPSCIDCHSKHAKTAKRDTPPICGKCHTGILSEYKNSIHGKLLLNGSNVDAPACTDCHGSHIIAQADRPEANVYSKNIPKTCAKCHAVGTLMQKYGIKTEQVSTYRQTYHGKANYFGQLEVANCSSCHGIHNIKSITDPQSQVSKENLPITCGKCHPNALNNPKFSNVIMHLKPSKNVEPVVFYVQIFYKILIFLIIGGMFLYNIMDFIKRLREKKK